MNTGDADYETLLNIEFLCDQLRNSRRTDPDGTGHGKSFIRVYNVKQVTHFHYATATNRHSNYIQQRTRTLSIHSLYFYYVCLLRQCSQPAKRI